MTDDSVYDQWVRQRAEMPTADDMAARVLDELMHEADPPDVRPARPLVAAGVIAVATVAGLARVVLTILLGLHAI